MELHDIPLEREGKQMNQNGMNLVELAQEIMRRAEAPREGEQMNQLNQHGMNLVELAQEIMRRAEAPREGERPDF